MTINSLEVGDAAPLEWPRNPFPGLRPFREDECLIFYGRNSQKDEVLARLNQSQLVFITGPSGCGKSSLIKAGVLPALRAGLLTKAGYHWKILQMRPGRYPLGRIAAEFKSSSPAGAAASQSEQDLESLIRTEETALWLAADSIAPRIGWRPHRWARSRPKTTSACARIRNSSTAEARTAAIMMTGWKPNAS